MDPELLIRTGCGLCNIQRLFRVALLLVYMLHGLSDVLGHELIFGLVHGLCSLDDFPQIPGSSELLRGTACGFHLCDLQLLLRAPRRLSSLLVSQLPFGVRGFHGGLPGIELRLSFSCGLSNLLLPPHDLILVLECSFCRLRFEFLHSLVCALGSICVLLCHICLRSLRGFNGLVCLPSLLFPQRDIHCLSLPDGLGGSCCIRCFAVPFCLSKGFAHLLCSFGSLRCLLCLEFCSLTHCVCGL
mmetsp:Transcript_49666/g.158881  ORF Transcript_49666/g.158881 Transcript_49666/m.158881 type:complete len:243 (+) Transcript_49666:1242-1970(+)